MSQQDEDLGIALTFVFVVLVLFVFAVLGTQSILDECNATDEFGNLKHSDSWICSNDDGKRVKFEQKKGEVRYDFYLRQ